jgi:hypothetical protein
MTSSRLPPRSSSTLPSISMTDDVLNAIRHSGADARLKQFSPYLTLCEPLRYGQHLAMGAWELDLALGFDLGSDQKTSRHKSTTQYKTILST